MATHSLLAAGVVAMASAQDYVPFQTALEFCNRYNDQCMAPGHVQSNRFTSGDGTVAEPFGFNTLLCQTTYNALSQGNTGLTNPDASGATKSCLEHYIGSDMVAADPTNSCAAGAGERQCNVGLGTYFCAAANELCRDDFLLRFPTGNIMNECTVAFDARPEGSPETEGTQGCHIAQLKRAASGYDLCAAAIQGTGCAAPAAVRQGIQLDRRRRDLVYATVFADATPNLLTPEGDRVGEGRYTIGPEPREMDPYMTIDDSGNAHVMVRGHRGSTTVPRINTPTDFVSMIWVTDQSNAIVCQQAFNGPAAAMISTDACLLPRTSTTVQSHAFSSMHGLVSGPTLNVQLEVNVASREAQTSLGGVEGAARTVISSGPQVEHEPYLNNFDKASKTGRLIVLGANGSVSQPHPHLNNNNNLPVHYILAVWTRDQHGTVVSWDDLSTSAIAANVAIDVSAAVPPVTHLTPYSLGNRHGLFQGRDAFGFDTVLAAHTPTRIGVIPDVNEPYVQIHADRSATVLVRGNGGSTTSLIPMTPEAYTSNLYLLDQDGAVVCERTLDGTEGFATMTCDALSSDTVTVQAYQLSTTLGLFSGATLTVEWEAFATSKDETTSPSGSGNMFFRAATTQERRHDPLITYDTDSKIGSIAVLGDNGDRVNLYAGVVTAIYARDQHGTVVTYTSMTDAGNNSAPFDLNAVVPNATSLIPYAFSESDGLYRGLNALGLTAVRTKAVLGETDANGDLGTPTGRYETGPTPVMLDPYMKIGADYAAMVSVRGPGGSLTTLAGMSPGSFISNIWVADEAGNVICERLFGGRESSPTMTCALPESASTVQSHAFHSTMGLRSGPVLNVANEVFASTKEENATLSGTMNMATASAQKFQPVIMYNAPSMIGYALVLGDGGSASTLCSQDSADEAVEALWARDQHGSIVLFHSFGEDAYLPLVNVDLRAVTPVVTTLTPFEYGGGGLWQGNNAIAAAQSGETEAAPTTSEAPGADDATNVVDTEECDGMTRAGIAFLIMWMLTGGGWAYTVCQQRSDKPAASSTSTSTSTSISSSSGPGPGNLAAASGGNRFGFNTRLTGTHNGGVDGKNPSYAQSDNAAANADDYDTVDMAFTPAPVPVPVAEPPAVVVVVADAIEDYLDVVTTAVKPAVISSYDEESNFALSL